MCTHLWETLTARVESSLVKNQKRSLIASLQHIDSSSIPYYRGRFIAMLEVLFFF